MNASHGVVRFHWSSEGFRPVASSVSSGLATLSLHGVEMRSEDLTIDMDVTLWGLHYESVEQGTALVFRLGGQVRGLYWGHKAFSVSANITFDYPESEVETYEQRAEQMMRKYLKLVKLLRIVPEQIQIPWIALDLFSADRKGKVTPLGDYLATKLAAGNAVLRERVCL